MKIKVERTGGFAGIATSKEIDTDDLPSHMTKNIRQILNTREFTSMSSIPKGAADHFNYRITIQDETKDKVVECNQYNMNHDLKEIIKYVEEMPKKK